MRDRLKLFEVEEARRAFDGVDRAENPCDSMLSGRVSLKRNQLPIEQIEVFSALRQKLRQDLIIVRHVTFLGCKLCCENTEVSAKSKP